MIEQEIPKAFTRKLIDSLHVEAMVLADEARSYFDGAGVAQRTALDPRNRVLLSCEALKVTTRLMHGVAWLLCQRAQSTELKENGAGTTRLGRAARTDLNMISQLPDEATRIIIASEDIYDRIERLDASLRCPSPPEQGPARNLHDSLIRAF